MKKLNTLIIAGLFTLMLVASVSAASSVQYGTRLLGINEVPAVMTTAYGTARFSQQQEGALKFKIDVHRISPVTAAHIHCAPVGVNGPVGVTLFSGGPVDVEGLLVAGTITAPDAGNGCGWLTVDDIVNAIESGNAYVNVHTTTHPSGEIRGQLAVTP